MGRSCSSCYGASLARVEAGIGSAWWTSTSQDATTPRKWRLRTGSCMAFLMRQKQCMLELYTFVLWTLLVASTPLLSWQRQRWLLSRGSLYLAWNSVEHFSSHNYFNIVRRFSVSLLKMCSPGPSCSTGWQAILGDLRVLDTVTARSTTQCASLISQTATN